MTYDPARDVELYLHPLLDVFGDPPLRSTAPVDGTLIEADEILVLVDFQTLFRAVNDSPTVRAAKQQVEEAVAAGRPIVVLEYTGRGPTHPFVAALLLCYERLAVRSKATWDGGELVLEACRHHNFRAPTFTVIGVNTNECVQATVETLAKTAGVKVVKSACNSDKCNDWDVFESIPNVVLTD
jgi:nicotinamidase-related amidase